MSLISDWLIGMLIYRKIVAYLCSYCNVRLLGQEIEGLELSKYEY